MNIDKPGILLLLFILTGSHLGAQNFRWPVENPRVTQDYACHDCARSGYHSGIDLKDGLASCDTSTVPIYPVATGQVRRIVRDCPVPTCTCSVPDCSDCPARKCGGGYGNHIVVEHDITSDEGAKLYSLYAHLRSDLVSLHQDVTQDMEIGTMGNTGNSDGCHLHVAILDYPPGTLGRIFDETDQMTSGSGVIAYPPDFPTVSCDNNGNACLDLKDFFQPTAYRINQDLSGYDAPSENSRCIVDLTAGQIFLSQVQQGEWVYVNLPADSPPESDPTNGCGSDESFAWVNDVALGPASGFIVRAKGEALAGQGLNVRETPGGIILTKLWANHSYWATGATAPSDSFCDESWFEIHVPASRAAGNTRGWACGDFLEFFGGQCREALLGDSFYAGLCSPSEPPTVQTLVASRITEVISTLNMSVNPNGLSSRAWFRWGLSQSVSNTTDAVDVGFGTTEVPLSVTLDQLECDQTYFFQAWAENSQGQASGDILSFQTDPCATDEGSDVEDLILNGDFSLDDTFWSVQFDFHADRRFSNYNFGPGYAYLSEADGDPGNNLVGILSQEVTIPANAESALLTYWLSISTDEPSGSSGQDVLNVTLQDENGNFLTTLRVYSNRDASFGYLREQFNLVNFIGDTVRLHFLGTTNSDAEPTVFRIDDVSLEVEIPTSSEPIVATLAADQISATSARLNMTANPNGAETTVWFDLEAGDTTPNDDTPSFPIGSGTTTETLSDTVTNLTCDTLYFFRANASNQHGSGQGSVLSFTTDECPGNPPIADTDPATQISGDSARLVAEINPGGLSTTAWFEWGTSAGLGRLTVQRDIGSSTGFIDFIETLSGLQCGTEYFFKAVAVNGEGRDEGVVHSFTTTACPEPNTPPVINVIEPDGVGDIADQSYNVTWSDSDPDDNAVISLAYSASATCSSPVTMTSGISEDALADSFTWNTSALPMGTYHILATISDGVNPTSQSCSSGGVVIDHGPSRIFSDGFESGDTSRWSSVKASSGSPSSSIVFQDAFDDNSIDSSKWEIGGLDTMETGGQFRVQVNATDQGGWAKTKPFTIDPSQPLTIARRVALFAANEYFDGNIGVHIEEHSDQTFGVSYAFYHYTGDAECVTVGFSVFRNNANSHRCADRESDASELITPIWGTWLTERIVYDPQTGKLQYFIDDEQRIAYNVGSLPAGADSIWLSFSAWGWHTGHYQYMDWIEVTTGQP